MRTRWYLSTLIIFLTLLGAICHQGSSVPNQEIVLQFANNDITLDEAQIAITTVKEQLQTIGADNILVQEQGEGRLKITYYSNTDVASIKKILSKEKEVALKYAAHHHHEIPVEAPSDKTPMSYNLDIYEIQDESDVYDLGGKLAIEIKAEHERCFNPNVFLNIEVKDVNDHLIINTAYKLNRSIAIAIDHNTRTIPEVRAGPISS